MPANADMKDAVDVPGQRLGKRRTDDSFSLKLMLIGLVFPDPKGTVFHHIDEYFNDMNINT